ncbi:hypothetical protein HYU13_00760 [Candidatus Woesearchaeota archaeon]|nr:hypothetical protein [Candidatus Woesearchaeota archaeon]
MNLTIDRKIFEKFPGLIVGVVACRNLDNVGVQEEIQNGLRAQEQRILGNFSAETLSQHLKIDAWRKAYAAFGGKPKENRSSVESLYRLALKGIHLRHINKLVDIYNFISLKHMVPAGGEDVDKIKGDAVLTFAGPDEAEVLLLGDKVPRKPHAGEVIYKDNISAICRRWNWREADRTKFTEETKNCFLVLEGLPPVLRKEIEAAVSELKELVQKFCGGEVSCKILDKECTVVEVGE